MSIVDVPIYDMTTMTPVILMAIGCAYGIHILNRYQEEATADPARGKKTIVLQTMLTIWPPVVMSSLTTAVGFASLATSSLTVIRSFGIFTGLGILCALIFSLTFIPAGLMLVKVPDAERKQKGNRPGFLRTSGVSLSDCDLRLFCFIGDTLRARLLQVASRRELAGNV